MNRRRYIFFVIAILATISLSSEVSASGIGSSCKRVGATSNSGGKVLVCKRVGSQLRWVASASGKTGSGTGGASATPGRCFLPGGQTTLGGTKYECRRVAGSKYEYVPITARPGPVENPTSPDNLEACRLPDLRASNVSGQAITYPPFPVSPNVTNSGVVNIAVIFVDFPDVAGTAEELPEHVSAVKLAADWIDWYSQGSVRYNLRIASEWTRAPDQSLVYSSNQHKARYGLGGNQLLTDDELASRYLDLARKAVDMNGATVLWVVHPKKIKEITESFMYRNPAKTLILSIGSDTYNDRGGHPIWQQFLHETLHSHGLLGHTPKHEFFNLMRWNGSPGASLNSWDAMTLGWMRPQNLYCIRKENIVPTKLTLAALEREQQGVRGVIIRLSNAEALVIESHRREKWSLRWPAGTYGVTVMRIDTRIDTEFNEGSATSVYLMEDRPNSLMVQGESFVTDGVKISLVKSGDNDTIEIAPAG